jgi:hypothetical protein
MGGKPRYEWRPFTQADIEQMLGYAPGALDPDRPMVLSKQELERPLLKWIRNMTIYGRPDSPAGQTDECAICELEDKDEQ